MSSDGISQRAEFIELGGSSTAPQPLVSVVIPAYNAEKTIGTTLRSVRGQTYSNLEILVVDDGSVDGTSTIVRQHAASDGRITLLTQANMGVAAARNHGWLTARAEFIAFVDADDLWAPTKIEKQMAKMLAGGPTVGLVYTWFSLVDEQNRVRYQVDGQHVAGEVLVDILLENFIGHASSPLIRREALDRVGGFSSQLREHGAHGCEDLLLYQRIAAMYHYALVPEHLTGYRMARGRMSSDRIRMLRSFELVAEESRRIHPDEKSVIDAGTRKYLIFQVGQAAAEFDIRECWSLLKTWSSKHPLDVVLVPFAMLWLKLKWRLKWMGRFIVNPKKAWQDAYFEIGNSHVENQEGHSRPTERP